MKYILSLIISLSLASFSSAQSNKEAKVNFGPIASIGFQLANDEVAFAGDPFDYINHEITYRGANLIKSYGFFGQQKFGYLFARTELAFTHFKQEYTVRSFVQFGQPPRTVLEKFQFIDFRVISGLTHNDVRIGVGPIAHILVGNDDTIDFISGYSERHRGVTFGFLFTAGIDAGRLHIDLRYENNFRTVGDHIYLGGRSARYRNKPHAVQLVVGVSI